MQIQSVGRPLEAETSSKANNGLIQDKNLQKVMFGPSIEVQSADYLFSQSISILRVHEQKISKA